MKSSHVSVERDTNIKMVSGMVHESIRMRSSNEIQQTLEISHRINSHVVHVDLELGESLQLVKQVQAILMLLTL